MRTVAQALQMHDFRKRAREVRGFLIATLELAVVDLGDVVSVRGEVLREGRPVPESRTLRVPKRPEHVRAVASTHDLQGHLCRAQACLLVVLAPACQCLAPEGARRSKMDQPDTPVLYPCEHEAQDARTGDVEPVAVLELKGAASEQPGLAHGSGKAGAAREDLQEGPLDAAGSARCAAGSRYSGASSRSSCWGTGRSRRGRSR